MTKFNKSLVAANLLISDCREIVIDKFVKQSSDRAAEIQVKNILPLLCILEEIAGVTEGKTWKFAYIKISSV